MKNIISILIVFILLGCRAPRGHLNTTDIKQDSIHYATNNTILAPILSQLIINDICDSITGKPRAMSQKFARGKDTIFVEVGAEGLKIKYAAGLDSLKSVYESKLSTHVKTSDELRIKYEVPKWAWWAIGIPIGTVLTFLIFPGIPRFINQLVVKVLF